MNKAIVTELKKRLKVAKDRWVEELLNVLWAYHTTPRRFTGEMPFSMTYGAEVAIPEKIGLCSMRVSNFMRRKMTLGWSRIWTFWKNDERWL